MLNRITCMVLGLVGGTIGGVLGYYVFSWIVSQGFYGLMIPGALLGLGSSMLAKHRSAIRGVVCGLAALALGFYVEWRFFPFADDHSIHYFATHIHHLKPLTLLMVALGGLFGYWLGKDSSPIFGGPAQAQPTKPASRPTHDDKNA